jgi:hypothetical protein
MLKAMRNKGKFQLAKAATVMGLVSSWLLYGAALKRGSRAMVLCILEFYEKTNIAKSHHES